MFLHWFICRPTAAKGVDSRADSVVPRFSNVESETRQAFVTLERPIKVELEQALELFAFTSLHQVFSTNGNRLLP